MNFQYCYTTKSRILPLWNRGPALNRSNARMPFADVALQIHPATSAPKTTAHLAQAQHKKALFSEAPLHLFGIPGQRARGLFSECNPSHEQLILLKANNCTFSRSLDSLDRHRYVAPCGEVGPLHTLVPSKPMLNAFCHTEKVLGSILCTSAITCHTLTTKIRRRLLPRAFANGTGSSRRYS